MDSNRITFAQIMEQRQKEAHEREQQFREHAAATTEQLMNENSKFMKEFDEEQQRIFGYLPPR